MKGKGKGMILPAISYLDILILSVHYNYIKYTISNKGT